MRATYRNRAASGPDGLNRWFSEVWQTPANGFRAARQVSVGPPGGPRTLRGLTAHVSRDVRLRNVTNSAPSKRVQLLGMTRRVGSDAFS